MKVTLIVAVARNGVIGVRGDLPWRLPGDMKFFKRNTLGHHVVMGRKTWESLPKPLAERVNVVLTRDPDYAADGGVVLPSFPAAVEFAEARGEEELFVIGGASIYAEALEIADRILWTEVDADPDGDTRFPDFDRSQWHEVSRAPYPADDRNPHAYTFVEFERVAAP